MFFSLRARFQDSAASTLLRAPFHAVSAALQSQMSMLFFTYYAVRCKDYKFLFIETPVFITEPGTSFPFRRKQGDGGRKNVEEGDRKERNLQMGEAEFEIVTERSK